MSINEALISRLMAGDWLYALILIIISFVCKYKEIYTFLNERKKIKIERISQALECSHVTGKSRSYLEAELETESFWLATGLRATTKLRNAILAAYDDAQGRLSFENFKVALPYLVLEQGRLEVRISKVEYLDWIFFFCTGVLLGFLGLVMVALPSQVVDLQIKQALSFMFFGFLFFSASIPLLFQTIPVSAARKIKKMLASFEVKGDEL